jgi:glyoxylase I family protein
VPFDVEELTPLLEVFDLPASLAFYRDILGFSLLSGDDQWWCIIGLGETRIMLNTAYEHDERPPAPDPARVRGHGDISLYFSTPDPDRVYAELREKGCTISEPTTTDYGMRQVSLKDPDGYRLFFVHLPHE